MKLAILTYPNDILKQRAYNVELGKLDEYQDLIDDMIETMNANNGLGLAANQIGVLRRIFVYGENIIVNPVVLARTGKITSHGEGCLSIPETYYNLKRYRQIVVQGYDRYGNEIRVKSKNKNESIVIQHEIDHLNGITIKDRK